MRALPIPLPLLQIAAGALLAWPCGLEIGLEPDTFLLVFVAPLLFIDGFQIPKRELKRFRRIILMLAFGLVVLSVLAAGTVITWCLPDIPKPVAFAIAAALAPTDAVALSGITGRAKMPGPIMHVLSGEALMNDASGLVCLRVSVAAIATGTFSWAHAAGQLAVVAIGGMFVGAIVTMLSALAVRLVFGNNDEEGGPRTLIVLLLPFAAYLAAEAVHVSGILAAVAAGIWFTRFEIIEVDHRLARRHTRAVLGMTAVALNGLIFVLLGLQLPQIWHHAEGLRSTMPIAKTVVMASLAMFAARLAWIWVSMALTVYRSRRRGGTLEFPPGRLVLATGLAGVRGAVSLAAALTIPVVVRGGYPAREVAITIAAGVILFSLVTASLLLPLMLRGISMPVDSTETEEEITTRAALTSAALAAIEAARDARMEAAPDDAQIVSDAAAWLMDRYRRRSATEDDGSPARSLSHERDLRSLALRAERDALQSLIRHQKVDTELYRRIVRELDAAEEFLNPLPARSSHEAE